MQSEYSAPVRVKKVLHFTSVYFTSLSRGESKEKKVVVRLCGHKGGNARVRPRKCSQIPGPSPFLLASLAKQFL